MSSELPQPANHDLGFRDRVATVPPLRGWFDKFSSPLFHCKISAAVATQSLEAVPFKKSDLIRVSLTDNGHISC
jgi:hypothetical protein